MRKLKRIVVVIVVLLLLLQLIPRPDKNNAPEVLASDIRMQHNTSPEVEAILKSSCFDCHSNHTVYPWYSKIQPVAWWLGKHIDEGKKELNFSEYGNYSIRRKYHKMDELEEMVNNGEMPLKSYSFIHTSSRLNQEQRKILIDWSIAIRDSMRQVYPADSLISKKHSP